MNEYTEKIKNAVLKNKKLCAVLILCISALVFITLSGNEKTVNASTEVNVSDAEYTKELENKIKGLVTAITGDKDLVVAVTLETGNEYIYADQNKVGTDLSKDSENGETSTKEKETKEQEYIIIKSGDGSEKPLIVTEKKPTVRGVAIVSGGVNEQTEAEILSAVTSVLGIASRKISIVRGF